MASSVQVLNTEQPSHVTEGIDLENEYQYHQYALDVLGNKHS